MPGALSRVVRVAGVGARREPELDLLRPHQVGLDATLRRLAADPAARLQEHRVPVAQAPPGRQAGEATPDDDDVANAKDNAAVWAISKVMESDVEGFKGISDALGLGQSTVAVSRQASETVTDLLKQMKGKIVAAQGEMWIMLALKMASTSPTPGTRWWATSSTVVTNGCISTSSSGG